MVASTMVDSFKRKKYSCTPRLEYSASRALATACSTTYQNSKCIVWLQLECRQVAWCQLSLAALLHGTVHKYLADELSGVLNQHRPHGHLFVIRTTVIMQYVNICMHCMMFCHTTVSSEYFIDPPACSLIPLVSQWAVALGLAVSCQVVSCDHHT